MKAPNAASKIPVIIRSLMPGLRDYGNCRRRVAFATRAILGRVLPRRSYVLSCTSLFIPPNDTGRRYREPFSMKLQSALRRDRSEEHTSELQSLAYLVSRLL